MTLGDIIKAYRTEHKLSMDAFSDRSGISKAYISLLEKNKHPKTGKEIAPSIQSIKQAAHGMGMTFDELFALIDCNVSVIEESIITTDTDDMSEQEFNKIFSRNLKKYISLSNKTQKEIAYTIGVSPQTFNTWCQGIALPRMGKVQALADYFGINKTDLIDDKSTISETSYYLNDETAKVAQEIFEKDKVLFDVYRSSDKDRLVAYANKLKALRDMEEGNL